MIEELCKYLERHGWDEDTASDVHVAYYDNKLEGVVAISEGIGEDELVAAVKRWKHEIGED